MLLNYFNYDLQTDKGFEERHEKVPQEIVSTTVTSQVMRHLK